MKGRLFMISIFVLLFIGTVIIFGSAITTTHTPVYKQTDLKQNIMINKEGGVFTRSADAMKYKDMPEGNRTMATYYNNRAYPGAPPQIPHKLLSETGIGGKECLQCHKNGGYVQQFAAFAPVSPHPEWLNCKQCHVPINKKQLFANTNWEKPKGPKLGQRALITSPLIMPHGLQNRENCLSCHAGPAAPKEIRVSHPERINCRQCHVPHTSDKIFFTPVEDRKYPKSGEEVSLKKEKMEESELVEIKKWVEKSEKLN